MSTPLHDSDVVIVAGARTPFGNLGGARSDLTATDLAVAAAEAAIARSGVPKERIDDVVFGNVMQTSADAIYLARHVGLRAGLPIDVPALTRTGSADPDSKRFSPQLNRSRWERPPTPWPVALRT